jgi:hypothetical protein
MLYLSLEYHRLLRLKGMVSNEEVHRLQATEADLDTHQTIHPTVDIRDNAVRGLYRVLDIRHLILIQDRHRSKFHRCKVNGV